MCIKNRCIKSLAIILIEIFIFQQIFIGAGFNFNQQSPASSFSDLLSRRVRGAYGAGTPFIDGTINPETASEIELEQAVQRIFSQLGDLGAFGFDIDTSRQRVVFSRPPTADYERALGEAWFDGTRVHLKTVDEAAKLIEHKLYDSSSRRITGFKRVMLIEGNSYVITCDIIDDNGEDFDFKFAVYDGDRIYQAAKSDDSLGLPGEKRVERDVIVRGNEYTIRIPDLKTVAAPGARSAVPDTLDLNYRVEQIEESKWRTTVTINGEQMGVLETSEEPVISNLQLGFDPATVQRLTFKDAGVLREVPVLSDAALEEMVDIIEGGIQEEAVRQFSEKYSLGFRGAVKSFKALAYTLMGAEVAAWIATKVPLTQLMGRGGGTFANVPLLAAQAALMVPLLTMVAKFGIKSWISPFVDRGQLEIPMDRSVLEHRFGDQGFSEGVGVMYTAYFGEGPEARVKIDKCIRNIARTIKGNISEDPQKNKNLYFIFVSDDSANKETMLYLLEKFDQLFKEFGDKVNLLFTTRERAQQVGWKWGSQWDVMGIMSSLKEQPNTRIYTPLTFSDPSVHSLYARDPQKPVFEVPGDIIKEAAGKGASGRPRILTFDLGIGERQLKATGWMWKGPALDASTGIDSLIGKDAIKHLLVLDEGDVMGVNQVVEMAARIKTARSSADYADVSIFLPELHVANPHASALTEFASSAQERFAWHDLTTFRIRQYMQASGKMWIVINDYVKTMMEPGKEGLGAYNISHDYIESARLKSIRLVGVHCYDSRPVTIDAQDDVISQHDRWVKGDETALMRSIWGRYVLMQKILKGIAGEDLSIPGMPIPDDPEWASAVKEMMGDIAWFIKGNLLYSAYMGLTLTTGAVSAAMAQTNPALSLALLGLVLGAQLVGGPLLMAPTVQRVKDRNLERLEQAAEDVEKGLWDKVRGSLPGIIAEEIGRGFYDWMRGLVFVMPLFPAYLPMVLLNGRELLREYQIEASYQAKINEGKTKEQALAELAFEMDNTWTHRAKNYLYRMLGLPEQHYQPSDVLKLGKIRWKGADIPQWAKYLYRGVAPLLGAGIYAALYAAGITPDTAGGIMSYAVVSTIALPFLLYPLTTMLLSKFNNTKYTDALSQAEASFGEDFRVGWAFNMAHASYPDNYDYAPRIRGMIDLLQRGRGVTDIWDSFLTAQERACLLDEFDGSRSAAEAALARYLNNVLAYLGG